MAAVLQNLLDILGNPHSRCRSARRFSRCRSAPLLLGAFSCLSARLLLGHSGNPLLSCDGLAPLGFCLGCRFFLALLLGLALCFSVGGRLGPFRPSRIGL